METKAGFGLLIIGDELLSGKRQDKHFQEVRRLLGERGLQLDWVQYLGDAPARITETLRRTFASSDIVFSCGGIGATPDDHTRQAAAAALELPLVAHAEAQTLIAERMREVEQPLTPERLRMGEFPHGARLIPNPFNRIPGFNVAQHWFVPGFPVMAWPMLAWVLDTHYAHLFHQSRVAEKSQRVTGLAEGTLTPLMEQIEVAFPGIRVFSLPHIDPAQAHLDPEKRMAYEIELGVKGPEDNVEAAFEALQAGVAALLTVRRDFE